MKALNILVVDDEPGIRDLMTDALSAQGHAVLCAANGVEAVASTASRPVDIRVPGYSHAQGRRPYCVKGNPDD